MILRNCAGGIVFYDDEVFVLQNDKKEWVLPKGGVKEGNKPEHVALDRVKIEGGIDAEVIDKAGATSYEFYSTSRKQPVCNEITWYLMRSNHKNFDVNVSEGFLEGGFFPIDEAIEKITYSQDKSLLRMASEKYRNLRKI